MLNRHILLITVFKCARCGENHPVEDKKVEQQFKDEVCEPCLKILKQWY
jgi:formylmethanofuran dehydrogenase subunit E